MAELSPQQRLERARSRVNDARQAQARAQVQQEQAEAASARTRETLSTEFGAATADDIRRVRGELQAAYDKALAEIEKSLEEAGA